MKRRKLLQFSGDIRQLPCVCLKYVVKICYPNYFIMDITKWKHIKTYSFREVPFYFERRYLVEDKKVLVKFTLWGVGL
jgi:hypothetical protein